MGVSDVLYPGRRRGDCAISRASDVDDASRYGAGAGHLSGRAGWWSISHAAKGYTLDQVPFHRKADAMQAARALAAKPEVWENLDKPGALEEACRWYVEVMDELGFRHAKYNV